MLNVDHFQQPRTKLTMNLNSTINNLLANLVFCHYPHPPFPLRALRLRESIIESRFAARRWRLETPGRN